MPLDDKRLELPDLARLIGIHPQTLLSRIQTGWTLRDALLKPVQSKRTGVPPRSDRRDRIQLTQGRYALIDEEDYDRLSLYWWRPFTTHGLTYARRTAGNTCLFMHRVITDAPAGAQVDHINGDTLDNRKSNLRVVGSSENQQNRHRQSTNTSGYKGVSWSVSGKKWQSSITRLRKVYHLGFFDAPEDAARAYDAKASELYGVHARINFPVTKDNINGK
jgi:hypothetical protein